jgi:NADPH:quinone reductase
MQAIQIVANGGPEVLRPVEVPARDPGPGEVAVQVLTAGVNFIDTYQRSGLYPLPLPLVLGMEGMGRVVAAGAGVAEYAPGDRVAWLDVMGSYAQHLVAPADRLVPVPDGLADATACALMLQGVTAQYLVRDTAPLHAGMTCLIHAAAGGVGLLLVQLAVAAGARVVATVGSPEKAELARAAGAHEVLDARDADLAAAVSRVAGERGIDVVYDGVGKATFDVGMAVLRRRGVMVSFGNASGPVPPIAPLVLSQNGSLYLTRPQLKDYVVTTAELRGRVTEVFSLAVADRLSARIGLRLPLDQARAAHEALESRATTGKILLTTA